MLAVVAASVSGAVFLFAQDKAQSRPTGSSQGADWSALPRADRPVMGTVLNYKTPEGFAYSAQAVAAGSSAAPLPLFVKPPGGSTYAYADYVLTNSTSKPEPLDFPAALLIRRSATTPDMREHCVPLRIGPQDRCSPVLTSKVLARLGDSPVPSIDPDGDVMLPPAGSYLIRVVANTAVIDTLKPDDLSLFLWGVRYLVAKPRPWQLPFPQ